MKHADGLTRFNLTFGPEYLGGWIDAIVIVVFGAGGQYRIRLGTEDLVERPEDEPLFRFDWKYPMDADHIADARKKVDD